MLGPHARVVSSNLSPVPFLHQGRERQQRNNSKRCRDQAFSHQLIQIELPTTIFLIKNAFNFNKTAKKTQRTKIGTEHVIY